MARKRSLEQVNRAGIDALVDKLGIYDTIRFIQANGLGQGDWTKERGALQDLTPAEIERKALALQRHQSPTASGRKAKVATRKPAPQGR